MEDLRTREPPAREYTDRGPLRRTALTMFRRLKDWVTGASAHWNAIDESTRELYFGTAAKVRATNENWCVVFAEGVATAAYCANLLFGPHRERMTTRDINSRDLLSVTHSQAAEFYDAIVMAFVNLFMEEHQQFRESIAPGMDRFLGYDVVIPTDHRMKGDIRGILRAAVERARKAFPILDPSDPILEYCLSAQLLTRYRNGANRVLHRINTGSLVTMHEGKAEVAVAKRLYKYRDWSNPLHRRMITDREVYFASPECFADGFDCRVTIRFDLSSENLAKRHIATLGGWVGPEVERTTDRSETALFDRHAGILSLTAIPDNQVMWEQYGNSHSGFCVGFEPSRLLERADFGREVMYSNTLPAISFEEESLVKIQKQLFTKLLKWNYEREYRMIVFSGEPLNEGDRRVALPPEAFSDLIFGARMPEGDRQEIVRCVASTMPHVRLWEGRVSANDGKVRLETYK